MRIYLDSYGIKIISDELTVRFGNKKYAEISSDPSSSAANECFIKQVHGTECVEASSDRIEVADAHWSQEFNQLCIIKTADCIPLFAIDSKNQRLLAIHAGWRGLVGGIVENSIRKVHTADYSQLKIFIGPHIGKDSFEVDKDVYDQIEAWSFQIPNNTKLKSIWFSKIGEKYFINLEKLSRMLLASMGISNENIFSFSVDTKTSMNWNSYRRSSGDPGRNLSWGRLHPKAK